ncbi:MAG: zinc ribbon domain-containing protein [Clostridia bacterium]|nr:zinc ribbon domain-containing protein [Clostridia bacterium]
MWKCIECGENSQGLFCSNCGAPMTEEGEKLNIDPTVEEVPVFPVEESNFDAVETEPKATFKSVLAEVVSSKKFLISTILLTAFAVLNAFGFEISENGFNVQFNFNIYLIILIVGLFACYKSAKSNFNDEHKNFSIVRGSSLFLAIAMIVVSVLCIAAMGIVSLAQATTASEGAPLFGDMVVDVNGLSWTLLGEKTSFEFATGVAEAITITSDIILAVLWSMVIIGVIIATVVSIVNFRLAKMFKSIVNKLNDETAKFIFTKGVVKFVRIWSILSIVFTAWGAISYTANLYGLIMTLTGIAKYVAYLMLTGLVIQLQIKTEELENQEA